jgi:hypothetical protein
MGMTDCRFGIGDLNIVMMTICEFGENWRKLNYIYASIVKLYDILNVKTAMLLGRPRRRWEDNVRMDLQEVGCGLEDWIGLAQDRDRWRVLVSAVGNLRVP